jgi:hypothetical protein
MAVPGATLLAACTALLAACTFDTSGSAPRAADHRGGEALDAARTDREPDATADLPLVDQPPPDRAPDTARDNALADGRQPDKRPPDKLPSDSGSWCEATFGGVSKFLLCKETATACKFYVWLDGSSCDDTCKAEGATCLNAWDEGSSNLCSTGSSTTKCKDTHDDHVCECSHP